MSSLPLPLLLLRLCTSGQAFAKQNYRALWVMICPFLYSRWLEAESTPLPLSSIPMHVRKRRLFLSYSCFQPREARESPSQQKDAMGGISLCRQLQWAPTRKARFKCQPRAWAERRWHLHSDSYNMAVQASSSTILLWASGAERGNWDASGRSLLKPLSVRSCESLTVRTHQTLLVLLGRSLEAVLTFLAKLQDRPQRSILIITA